MTTSLQTAERTSISAPTDGLLLIDKPRGLTSHDVVGRLRRILKRRDIGHAGTLDPMATGLLVVLLGEATKLSAYLTADAKAYATTLRLGATTGSLDADAPISEELAVAPEILAELAAGTGPALTAALAGEATRTEQIPPAVSAIQVDGVRSYDRARRGEEVSLPPRAIGVEQLTLMNTAAEPPEVTVELRVSKGYYVRAFARDFAERLGTVAHLTALRRLRSGVFSAEEAVFVDHPAMRGQILPLADAIRRALPTIAADGATIVEARQGKRFAAEDAPVTGPFVLFEGDVPIAIAERDADGRGKVLRGFRVGV